MPILTLITNIPQQRIPPDVAKNASRLLSDLFDLPERNILVSIKAGVQMTWGTQAGSFALGTVQNTDPIEAEDTKQIAPQVFEFVERHLGIPQNRMYLGFITINPDNIAIDGKIYTALMDE